MEPKQTKGRQRIEMKQIDDMEDRLISFSKRRSGIYKKASELSTLCGTEIGILVKSPKLKSFTYGNPSLESVANRFLNHHHRQPSPGTKNNDTTVHFVEAHRRVRIHELNQQYNNLAAQLESEKKRGEILKQMARPKGKEKWWETPVDELPVHDLERLSAVVEELGRSVGGHRNAATAAASSSSSALSFLGPNQATQVQPYPGFPKIEDSYAVHESMESIIQQQRSGYGREAYESKDNVTQQQRFGYGRGFY